MTKEQKITEIHLHDAPFKLFQKGVKTIETRVNDPKRQLLKTGGIVEFTNRKTGEKMKATITNLFKYSNFEELFNAHPTSNFGDYDKNTLLQKTREFYPKEDEDKYGVLGIEVKILK